MIELLYKNNQRILAISWVYLERVLLLNEISINDIEVISIDTNLSKFEKKNLKCFHYNAMTEWYQTSTTKHFAKIVAVFYPLTILVEKHYLFSFN